MDILILYEHKERELTNAYLLKFELERRGYEVGISHIFATTLPSFSKPSLVIMPWLHIDDNFDFMKIKFLRKVDKVLNLEYEQIMSKFWLDNGAHDPKGLSLNACHICWGNITKDRFLDDGVPEDNLFITGDIRMDFTKKEFSSFFKSKYDLSHEFNIPLDHDWVLFISSFSFANPSKKYKDSVSNIMGESYQYWKEVSETSQNHIIQWIKKFLEKYPNKEFIYRPHPSEFEYCFLNDDLNYLIQNYDNFHFIFKYSVQNWIINCDFINSWISTSLVEVFSLNKPCNILRPVKIDEYFDIPYYINANHTTNFDDFDFYNTNHSTFPVPENKLFNYYINNFNNFVYMELCDVIEYIIKEDKFKQNFYKFPVLIEVILLLFKHVKGSFFKGLKSFFKNYFSKESNINENFDVLKNIVNKNAYNFKKK